MNSQAFQSSLSGAWANYVDGYGLYGENVFLTGSLVTKTASVMPSGTGGDPSDYSKYAGISTLAQIEAIKFGDSDRSNIVFWAGVSDLNDSTIQNTPFQVTQNGSIYAQQGVFEGSLITQSRLEGVDIYAARIHGIGNRPGTLTDPSYPGLSFYDIVNGISFYRNGEWAGVGTNTAKETFSIGTYGFEIKLGTSASLLKFIEVETATINNVEDVNNNIIFRTTQLQLKDNKISNYDNKTYYEVNNASLTGYVKEVKKLDITETETDINSEDIVFYGTMKYHKVAASNGYDLYVGV